MADVNWSKVEQVDTVIIGAGLSGIGLAYYMQRDCPKKSYIILEAREQSGGTWDLFKYPGIRSDSDLFTFGYEFKPWEDDKAIADGPSILSYIRETASENNIERHIRYQQKVVKANWDSENSIWQVTIQHSPSADTDNAEPGLSYMTCNWLFSAAGYYNYDQGYTPELQNIKAFDGEVVHPQHWPKDLDYRDKNVVIIGSGATAVTLLPAMADKTKHITMLQRTPTYIMSLPQKDPIANFLRKLLPSKIAYGLTRKKNISIARAIWTFCQKFPNVARKIIRYTNKRMLPKGYPVDEHFSPPYNPWDQRLCAVPDGDLFNVIQDGKASVVTDHIETFTQKGIALKSGRALEADIVITATGLDIQLFGGMEFLIDNSPVDLSKAVTFKGMMLSGIPNFAFAIGYTNASWTLKVGLLCEHFCRMINHMDANSHKSCEAELPSADMPTRPLLDFGAGYVQRVIDQLPRQGLEAPWYMSMDYKVDAKNLRYGPLLDENLVFDKQRAPIEHTNSDALDMRFAQKV